MEKIDEIKANTQISVSDGILSLNVPKIEQVQFAYYLSNSNGVLEKKWYSADNYYSFKLEEKDNYTCLVFIKKGNEKSHFEISFDYK